MRTIRYMIIFVAVGSGNLYAQATMMDFGEKELLFAGGQKTQQDTTFRTEIDEMPEPIDGISGIMQRIRYPESAKRDSIEGTIYIEAYIDEEGKVVRTNILRGVRKDLDDAGSEAVMQTKFIPGKIKGAPVKVQIVVPIRFRLSPSRIGAFDPEKIMVDRPTVFVTGRFQKLHDIIRYPEIAIRAGIQGEVQAQVLFQNQSIRQIQIIKGLGAGCDEAVMKAIAEYNFRADPLTEQISKDGSAVISVHFVLPRTPPPPPK